MSMTHNNNNGYEKMLTTFMHLVQKLLIMQLCVRI